MFRLKDNVKFQSYDRKNKQINFVWIIEITEKNKVNEQGRKTIKTMGARKQGLNLASKNAWALF